MNISLLIEANISDVEHGARQLDKGKRSDKSNTSRVMKIAYSRIENGLQINADVKGDTDNYQCTVQLLGLDLDIVEQPDFSSNDVVTTDGHHIVITDTDYDDVKVRCSCEDYRWTFANQNANKRINHGEPPAPYVPVSDPPRPPRNKLNTIGACKHLHSVFAKISQTLNVN